MRALIVGCGYVGLPLAAELVRQGHHVVGIRRSAAGADALQAIGVEPWITDISRADFPRIERPFDWVVFCAAAGPDAGIEGYRGVYLAGTRQLLSALESTPPVRYVYTSSTSVYDQQDGSVVTESSPAEASSPTAQVLLETERLLKAAAGRGFPAVILRVAGIYGPGRGHLFRQYLRGDATLPGRGLRMLNMIHRDDVVGAILAALANARSGSIYNVADAEPVTQADFYAWLSQALGRPLPPRGPEESSADRRRALTNKRVSSRRLTTDLGYRLRYPSFREGYAAEIQRLLAAGDRGLADPSQPGKVTAC